MVSISINNINILRVYHDKFNMDIDFLDEIGGKFKFTKPELNIILRNKGIGVPMSVDATFYGQNAEGDTLTLKLEKGKDEIYSINP